MPIPVIKFENTTKKFGRKNVINRINLEIHPGEIFGLIGPSGVGKTTFLQTLIGFHTPNEGDVLFSVTEEKNPKLKSIYRNLADVKKVFGYAAQQPSFYSQLTVYENLDYFASLYGVGSKVRKNNITKLIDFMALTNARNTLAQNLSGGMKRRLDIACALVHNPKILILDEPTSDLDPVLANHIWNLVKKINKKGTTIIVASHHISDLESICSRIGILLNGKITHLGTIQELFKKVSKGQEIHVETYPGNYDQVLEKFNDSHIIRKENRGFEMVLYSTKPEHVLHNLLHELNSANETVTDLRITKINLDDVYLSVVSKK